MHKNNTFQNHSLRNPPSDSFPPSHLILLIPLTDYSLLPFPLTKGRRWLSPGTWVWEEASLEGDGGGGGEEYLLELEGEMTLLWVPFCSMYYYLGGSYSNNHYYSQTLCIISIIIPSLTLLLYTVGETWRETDLIQTNPMCMQTEPALEVGEMCLCSSGEDDCSNVLMCMCGMDNNDQPLLPLFPAYPPAALAAPFWPCPCCL